MDDVLDDLVRLSRRAERAAREFHEQTQEVLGRITAAAEEVGRASAGLYIGYQATIYKSDLEPRKPGEHFDEDGYETVGDWSEFDYQAILAEVNRRAGNPDTSLAVGFANEVDRTFDDVKAEILPILDAFLQDTADEPLREARNKIASLPRRRTARDYVWARMPERAMTSDVRALQAGFRPPPHLQILGWIEELQSGARQLSELGSVCDYAAKYIERRRNLKGRTVAKRVNRIFIGHGRSTAWRDLKDFVVDRLKLEYEEYNREPSAGKSRKERLLEMLDSSGFAFIVLTGEDLHADESLHPRENVIHEAGLFQGRYGFERAIILLEDGCEEFSNIQGLDQIRFPKGNLMSKAEDIRRVLEREGIL